MAADGSCRGRGGHASATALTLATALAAASGVGATPVTGEVGVAARLDRVAAELARLKAERDAQEGRRALVAAAIEDATTRTAWLDDGHALAIGGDGGFDRRPVLRSADGDFELGLALHVQTRFVAGRLGDAGPGDDSTITGMELRRTRLKAVGHVLDERLRFQLGGGFSDDGDPFSITDAWAQWTEGEVSVRAGNFRPIFLREEQTSAKRLPGVERSLVSRLVRQRRWPGLMLYGTAGRLRLHAAVQDTGSFPGGDAWQVAGRAEVRLAGTWRSLRQETGFPGTEPAAVLGGGVLHAAASGGPDRTQATADLLWLGDGASVTLVAVLDDPEGGERGWGATVRGGWFATERTELVARVSVGDAEDELLAAGAGANWYVKGHDLKLQADVLHAFDGPGGRWRTSGTGWRSESGDGQTVLRIQAQVAF